MSNFNINDTEWAQELEQGLEEYMQGLYEALDAENNDEGEGPVTLSGQPFCGCETCITREMLWYATPIILQGQKDGAVELEV
jgi:hypothetical protein